MKIYQFPSLPIETQLFHAPGAGYDGGLTSGGAQFITPEPGGFSVLEVQPAIIDTEWIAPEASWLMSKISGQVLRIRLSSSPQVAWSRMRNYRLEPAFANEHRAENEALAYFSAAQKGEISARIDLAQYGRLLRRGHVIGHAYDSYLIDEISYTGDTADVIVTPPLRRNIASGDACLLVPWFTGRISNGADIRAAYDHLGYVKPGNIILQEAVV